MNLERKNKLKWNLIVGSSTGIMTVIAGTIVSLITGFKANEHNLIIPLVVWIAQLLVSYALIYLLMSLILRKSKRKLLNFGVILLAYNFSVIFVLLAAMFEQKAIDASYIDMYLIIMQVADFTYIVLKFSLMDKKELLNALDERKSDDEIIQNISENIKNEVWQVATNKNEKQKKSKKKRRGKK